MSATVKKTRMANLELLRCIAMMMVVVLHFLGKGNLLGDLTQANMSTVGIVAWLLEVFCIVAVNLYMMISGYFLCTSSFKLSRLINLWLQLWFYSVGVGLLAYVTGICPAEEFGVHYLLTLVFPVSMGHYWFLTAYVFLYLLLPFLGKVLKDMSKQQMQVAAGLLLFAFCILKSVLLVRLEMDGKGYDVLWYLCVFVTAAYIRRFGVPFLDKKSKGFALYVVGVLMMFAGTFGMREIYLRTGSLGLVMKNCVEYNHIFPFLAAVGLFAFFLKVRVPAAFEKGINKVAPYTLGVYLLHENIGVRYAWQKWFGAEGVNSITGLLLSTLLAVIVVFAVGICVDMLRVLLMKGLQKLGRIFGLYRKLEAKVYAIDEMFGK